jgi:hypothetical protein
MPDQTPKLKLTKPAENTSGWGDAVNANWDALDPIVVVSGSEPDLSDVAPGQVKAWIDQSTNKVKLYARWQDGKLRGMAVCGVRCERPCNGARDPAGMLLAARR